jgi:hypothetical protein
MAIVPISDFHDAVETDLADVALQRLLDDAEGEIVRRFGPGATHTDETVGLTRSVFVSRPAASITTVTERIGDTSTVLAADDYRLIGQRELRRQSDGTNSATIWGDEATILFVPVVDTAQRERVQVDLVKLALQYSGVQSEDLGGQIRFTHVAYHDERNRILSQLETVLMV